MQPRCFGLTMQYQNRIPPEGINTPGRHPLKEFLRLSVFAILALVSVGLLLNYSGGTLAGYIPFPVESWVVAKVDAAIERSGEDSPFDQNPVNLPLENYLHELAGRVQEALDIEEPMVITLHYSDEDTVNAYATLGGHVYLFKGLLEQLPHENALAMLIAHEFSHVQLRHPARGIGGGLAVAIGTALLPGSFENRFYTLTSRLTSMRFSRDMESSADENGLIAVQRMYGHVNGADDLFVLFMQNKDRKETKALDTFFSTHPLDTDRIEFISDHARRMGWSVEGGLTELPFDFKRWLRE